MKKLLTVLLVLFVIALIAGVFYLKPKLPIINGYAAKKTCSCTFISKRPLSSIQSSDLQIFPTNFTKNVIDAKANTVTTSLFGFGTRTAIYNKGLGCTLVPLEAKLKDVKRATSIKLENVNDNLFPQNIVSSNNTNLSKAIKNAFDKEEKNLKNTRAVVVLKNGKLIAEQYADGFDINTPILGWSMTKSITSALIGILVKQGKLSLDQNNLFTEWQKDKRKNITVNDLLHMGDGLDWNEVYSDISDATLMLYTKADFSGYALSKPYKYEPNTTWNYSSGTTNILSKLISNQFQNQSDYHQFFYEDLLHTIGMQNVELEADITGNIVGSSYCYATPRDWARFGQLYLNDGVWNGERLLPEGWVEYTYTNYEPSKGEYGAHWWLNKSNKLPDVPDNVYWCSGFQGQKVYVIPNENMIVVRMGISDRGTFDFNTFLSEIIEAAKN